MSLTDLNPLLPQKYDVSIELAGKNQVYIERADLIPFFQQTSSVQGIANLLMSSSYTVVPTGDDALMAVAVVKEKIIYIGVHRSAE